MYKYQHSLSANVVVVSMFALSLLTVLLPDSVSIGRTVYASANAYGPQASILCPGGSINISPYEDIPTIVAYEPAGSTFCILAGTHYPMSPIMPKAGDRLIGQYGAIIDGTNVTISYDLASNSIIRSWNCDTDCSGVLVQNLVLRSLANFNCIGIFGPSSSNWTIDHNEIHGCLNGVNSGSQSGARITNNYIHHNIGDTSAGDPSLRGGGVEGFRPTGTVYENNEIAYNGQNQKIVASTNVTFRNNYIHHNVGAGIWYDGDNTGMLVEGNAIEDQVGDGVFFEISADGTIRNNFIRRNGLSGIFISTSRNVAIYNNTLEDNFTGFSYFVDCAAVHPQGQPQPESIGWDLMNNNAHDNLVKVRTTSGAMAASLSASGSCTSAAISPYSNGSKNLVFQNNHYYTPTTSGAWWSWFSGLRNWNQWQALPQDTTGTLSRVPTANITAPTNGATVSSNFNVSVSASADKGVSFVDLYVNNTYFGTDTAFPYKFMWDTTKMPNGINTLRATVRDTYGQTADSATVSVNVNNVPGTGHIVLSPTSLSFSASPGTAPATRSVALSNSGTVTMNWTASADQPWCHASPISGSLAATTNTTLSVSVDSQSNIGILSCTITIAANADNSPAAIAVAYNVSTETDSILPTVSITSPVNNSKVIKKQITTITADAADNVSVSKVEFYVNNTLTCTDSSAPYACAWTVPGVINKTYVLTARAYDPANNVRTSSPISVTSQ